MDETHYHAIADATLLHCLDQLEDAFESGAIDDLELTGGILSILTRSGRTYILSKHAISRELWLASPVSGGWHFHHDSSGRHWRLPDGVLLYDILQRELAAEGITVIL